MLRLNNKVVHFTAVTVKASVDFDILSSLIILDAFPNIQSIEQLPDDVLWRWLKEQDNCNDETISVEQLEAMLQKKVEIKTYDLDTKI